MKKNVNKKPTIDTVSLGSLSFGKLFGEDHSQAPFEMIFYFGAEEGYYIGQYAADPSNFMISKTSSERLKELILSLENDMASFLFGESKTVEFEEEEDKLPSDIKQSLEYPAEDPFQL